MAARDLGCSGTAGREAMGSKEPRNGRERPWLLHWHQRSAASSGCGENPAEPHIPPHTGTARAGLRWEAGPPKPPHSGAGTWRESGESASGRFQLGRARAPSTSSPKSRMRSPRVLAKTASAGRSLYCAVPFFLGGKGAQSCPGCAQPSPLTPHNPCSREQSRASPTSLCTQGLVSLWATWSPNPTPHPARCSQAEEELLVDA